MVWLSLRMLNCWTWSMPLTRWRLIMITTMDGFVHKRHRHLDNAYRLDVCSNKKEWHIHQKTITKTTWGRCEFECMRVFVFVYMRMNGWMELANFNGYLYKWVVFWIFFSPKSKSDTVIAFGANCGVWFQSKPN